MFLRIKKVQNKEYVYLVNNRWNKRKRSSRQKTSKYLGRNYKLTKSNPALFEDFIPSDINDYFSKYSSQHIIKDLINHELLQHSFKLSEEKLKSSNFLVDINNIQVIDDKTQKPISLEMNEGFLNNYTLSNLLNIKYNQKTDKEIARLLADSLLSAGISIEEDIFILLYSRIVKELKDH